MARSEHGGTCRHPLAVQGRPPELCASERQPPRASTRRRPSTSARLRNVCPTEERVAFPPNRDSDPLGRASKKGAIAVDRGGGEYPWASRRRHRQADVAAARAKRLLRVSRLGPSARLLAGRGMVM